MESTAVARTPDKKIGHRTAKAPPPTPGLTTNIGGEAGVPLFLQRAAGGAMHNRMAAVAATGKRSAHSVEIPFLQADQRTPVRVYDNADSHAAAASMGAYAYAWGGDIFLGTGLGQYGTPSRDQALRHEFTHALQARQRGVHASEAALERQANAWDGHAPLLAADPHQLYGLWWVIPALIGAYILGKPNIANAPGPGDPTYPSIPLWQVALEAVALFGIPGGVGMGLAKAGFRVVAVTAAEGATAAVGYRGVQDIAAGEFSGVEAYVVDASTGALVGVVVGGVFSAIKGGGARWGTSPDALYHHTAALDNIHHSGEVWARAEGRVYTTPQTEIKTFGDKLWTGVGKPGPQKVKFTDDALSMFEPHPVEGPFSWYKWRGGQYVSKRVGYDLTFDPAVAARTDNVLQIGQAGWRKQALGRYLFSHSRMWSRRLFDWGTTGALAYGGFQAGAFDNYPQPGSLPSDEPGLSLAPEFAPSALAMTGIDGTSASASAEDSRSAPGLPPGVQIIYVRSIEHEKTEDANSVARYGYNAECPSCHTRINQPTDRLRAFEQLAPNQLTTGGFAQNNLLGGSMTTEQQRALQEYILRLQNESKTWQVSRPLEMSQMR